MCPLSVGFSRIDLTPPLGLHIPGYYNVRIADGVLDPITATAVTVSDGKSAAALLSLDFIGVAQHVAREWAQYIAERCGLAPEAVFLACTHTHTGPVLSNPRFPTDSGYNELVRRRLADAVTLALSEAVPVTGMYAGERELGGITFVRRFRMRDGSVRTWCKFRDPEILGPASEADETVRLLRIVREGAPEVLVTGFQLHPDCVGGTKYSADYPHFVRTYVERALPGTQCVYFNGAQGDLNHNNPFREEWEDPSKSHAKSRRLGQAVAGAVLQLYGGMKPIAAGPVGFARRSVTVTTRKDNSRLAEAEQLIELNRQGRDDELGPPQVSIPIVAEAYMLKRLEHEPETCELDVSAVSFGDAAFTGFPGEPFCGLGRLVREASPFELTFTCCLTNGNEGYIPEEKSYAEGGYEPKSSKLAPGTGERLARELSGLLRELRALRAQSSGDQDIV